MTTQMTVDPIAANEACRRLKQAVLVDVRTPAEFEEAHAPGSRNLPLHQIGPEKVRALCAEDQEVLLICRTGKRAREALEKLAGQGVERARVVHGGLEGWEARGLPVDHGRKTLSLERQVRIVAGSLVALGSLGALLLSPWWAALSLFVGCGLVFAGVTDTCGMAMLLARMPWNMRTGARCCS